LKRIALAALLALAVPAATLAQGTGQPQHPAAPQTAASPSPAPAESTTRHQVTIGGKAFDLVATVSTLSIRTVDGKDQGEVVATSFMLASDGASADPRTRPITFVVNGGPGASSAWLDLGAAGPWRLDFSGGSISPGRPPELVDNQESWLPFTDLVFLDPPGTGWARVLGGDEARKRLWSVDGDIAALASAVRQWLEANGRLGSPKMVAGESYGGFRGPRLVSALRQQQGVGIGGLLLVSPVLDFGERAATQDPWPWMTHLPSFAAIARAARGRDAVQDAERYAASDFLLDFTRGEGDDDAVARMSARVADLAGLDPTLVRQHDGRIESRTFLRQRGRATGTKGSPYDGLVSSLDAFPASNGAGVGADPVLDALRAPLGSAAMALYHDRLRWDGSGTYQLLNEGVARGWDFGEDRDPQSTDALRRSLALDPALRVAVTHGLYDLVTPYFASKLLLDQVPARVAAGRLRLVAVPGGHMMYSRDDARAVLRDVARWVAGGDEGPPPGAPAAP
jgi:carboxypeptidase C (cathepsin A)